MNEGSDWIGPLAATAVIGCVAFMCYHSSWLGWVLMHTASLSLALGVSKYVST